MLLSLNLQTFIKNLGHLAPVGACSPSQHVSLDWGFLSLVGSYCKVTCYYLFSGTMKTCCLDRPVPDIPQPKFLPPWGNSFLYTNHVEYTVQRVQQIRIPSQWITNQTFQCPQIKSNPNNVILFQNIQDVPCRYWRSRRHSRPQLRLCKPTMRPRDIWWEVKSMETEVFSLKAIGSRAD